jgi:predicted ATPase
MTRLRSVQIAGWKSIREIDPPLELGSINVLIGSNGAGKSNLVSFFRMMNALVEERLQTFIGQSGGANSVLHLGARTTPYVTGAWEFELEGRKVEYALRLDYAAPDSLILSDERYVYPDPEDHPSGRHIGVSTGGHRESSLIANADHGDRTARSILKLMKGCRVFHFHDTSETTKVRLSGYIEANRQLEADAGNLAALLYLYRQKMPTVYRRIVATVRKIFPSFDDFVLEPQRLNPRNILLNWRQKGNDYFFGPHQLSDGTLRAMALITLFLQPEEDLPSVIILDEPELGLHPHALEIVAGLIRAASLKAQVIVATQSRAFLDHFAPEEIIVVDSDEGGSRFRRLDAEDLKDWLEDYSIGELWEKNVIGGGPLP